MMTRTAPRFCNSCGKRRVLNASGYCKTCAAERPVAVALAPKPQSLSERAMLVDLNIRMWTAAKQDKKVSAEVAEAHGSEASMGHYYKQLLGREALERIRRIDGAAFTEHYARTLPWMNSGARVLSSTGYFDYTEKMRRFRAEYEQAVEDFVASYQDFVEDAKTRLNGMFNEADYPRTAEVRAKFGFETLFSPLPISGDFRVALGDAEVERIRQDIEKTGNEAIRRAMRDVANRIQTAVGYMADRLNGYTGKMEGSFRNSLVDNMLSLAELLPALNITADPRLDEVQDEMLSKLCLYDAETLRTSEAARNTTAYAAEAILEKMKEFLP